MPSAQAYEFESDLGAVKEMMSNAVTAAYASQQTSHWLLRCQFCLAHHIDTFLQNLSDSVPYLQVFAAIYRDSQISLSGRPVRAKTVSDALLSVASKFTRMGANDPKKQHTV